MEAKIDYKNLINIAIKYKQNAHCPYSKFKVGASVLCKSGNVYGGANIENASYPCGICAERVAVSKAISEGEKEFVAIAIVTDSKNYTYPCGICRQFLSEFGNVKIVLAKSSDDFIETDLQSLLPFQFNSKNIQKSR